MTERKTWAEIKAEKAAKRAAKGKPPIKTFTEIGREAAERKEAKRQAKLDRIAEKARARQGQR